MPIEFGIIPHDHWYQPGWVDEAKAKANRDKMMADVIYGGWLHTASRISVEVQMLTFMMVLFRKLIVCLPQIN